VHGLTDTAVSDGRPLGYYTMNGTTGKNYKTAYNYSKNSAVFHY